MFASVKYFRALIVFFGFFFFHEVKSQNAQCSAASLEQSYFISLYNFQFISAASKFRSDLPDNVGYLWRMYYNWWMLLSTNDKAYMSQCLANIVLYENHNNMRNDSLKIFFVAFRLRLLLLNHQYLKAYQLINNLADNYKVYVDGISNKDEQKLISGLMHYLGAKAYKNYPLFFHNKTFRCLSDTLGLRLLKECTRSNSVFVRTEGLYFLMKIHLEIEEDFYQAYIYSSQLVSLFPDNIIFGFHHREILDRINKKQEAEMYKARLITAICRNKELLDVQKRYLTQMINIKI